MIVTTLRRKKDNKLLAVWEQQRFGSAYQNVVMNPLDSYCDPECKLQEEDFSSIRKEMNEFDTLARPATSVYVFNAEQSRTKATQRRVKEKQDILEADNVPF